MLLLTLSLLINPVDMNQLRDAFHKIESQEQLEAFINRVEPLNCVPCEPYLASAIMQQARYQVWPVKKLKSFNAGKQRLEHYIDLHPEDLESRYLRVMVQANTPQFLGYRNHLKTDVDYIKNHISEVPLPKDYQQTILNNIKTIDL